MMLLRSNLRARKFRHAHRSFRSKQAFRCVALREGGEFRLELSCVSLLFVNEFLKQWIELRQDEIVLEINTIETAGVNERTCHRCHKEPEIPSTRCSQIGI